MNAESPLHIAVVGSRHWPQPRLMRVRVTDWMQKLHEKHPDAVIVSGGCPGVDITAETAALAFGHTVFSFRPRRLPVAAGPGFEIVLIERHQGQSDDVRPCQPTRVFRSYGQAAYVRNQKIVQHSVWVVAFTTGSRGTENTLEIAEKMGIQTLRPDVSAIL